MGRVYETALRLSATVSKTFRPDTYAAADAVKRLSAETAKLKKVEKATEQYGRLGKELAVARARFNGASEALARLKAAEVAAGGATKESAKWTRAGAREVAAATRQLNRASQAAGANAAMLHAAGINTAKLASEQARLATSIAATEQRTKMATVVNQHFGETLKKIGEQAKKYASVEGAAGKVRDATKSLFSDAAKLAAIGGAAGAGLAALTLKSLKAGDEIGDTADKLGIGTTALQELRYGARQSGAEVGELDAGLKKLAINIGKVVAAKKKGGGGFSGEAGGIEMLPTLGAKAEKNDPFKIVGLSAVALAKLKPDQQLLKIADAMGKMKTHAEKAAFVTATLGKSATALIPMLEEGSAGIARLSVQAHKYGGIMSPEQIAAADAADKAMKDAELAFAGVTNTLGSALLPTATKVFRTFSQWVADNREKIKQWAEQLAAWIEGKAIPAVMKIIPQVAKLVGQVARWIEVAADLTGGLGGLAKVIVAIRLAPLAAGALALAINLGRAAFGLAPFTAAAGSIMAVAAGLTAVYLAASKVADLVDEAQARKIKGEADAKLNASMESYNASPAHKAYLARVREPGGARGSLQFAPTINVNGSERGEVAKQIDQGNAKAKDAALVAFDHWQSRRRRLAYE